MLIIHMNYWAILVAAVVNMLIGAVWYMPMVFAKAWMKVAGLKKSDLKAGGYQYCVQFFATLLTVYVLSHVLTLVGAMDWMSGALGGFWAWLGFIATTSIMPVLWEKKSFKQYLINNGEILLMLLVSGAIIGAWR